MLAYWKEQLQRVIALTEEHIRELEAEKAHLADCKPPRTDMVREKIEAERRAIARLQRAIDALR